MNTRPAGSFELRLSDVICDFIEDQYATARITLKERREAYRRVRFYLALSDQYPTSHIKAQIRYRLRRKGEYRQQAPLPDAVLSKRRRVKPKGINELLAKELFDRLNQKPSKGT